MQPWRGCNYTYKVDVAGILNWNQEYYSCILGLSALLVQKAEENNHSAVVAAKTRVVCHQRRSPKSDVFPSQKLPSCILVNSKISLLRYNPFHPLA